MDSLPIRVLVTGRPGLLASRFAPTDEFYALLARKLLPCHELHARVPNRHRGATNCTGDPAGSSAPSRAQPSRPRVQFMHTSVQLVTVALAHTGKRDMLLT